LQEEADRGAVAGSGMRWKASRRASDQLTADDGARDENGQDARTHIPPCPARMQPVERKEEYFR
jgi:hypothetical protein